MSFASNLTMKDKQALLLYLGIVLLCAACFAIGIAVGRSSGEPQPPAAAPQTAVRNSQSSAVPGR